MAGAVEHALRTAQRPVPEHLQRDGIASLLELDAPVEEDGAGASIDESSGLTERTEDSVFAGVLCQIAHEPVHTVGLPRDEGMVAEVAGVEVCVDHPPQGVVRDAVDIPMAGLAECHETVSDERT